MQRNRYITLVLGSFLIISHWLSCSLSPAFSEIPEITFVGFSADSIDQGSLTSDSLFLTIGFRDGDGDLGSGATGVFRNIELIDNRTGDPFTQFKVPDLDIAGAMTGIEGTITMKLFTTCCLFPPDENIPPCSAPSQFPSDQLTLDIQLIDDSGNESNTLTTTAITLLCN